MLTIWMGRANTGKSARILEAIRTRREPAMLLVPEHASHTAELEVCRACGPEASQYVEVLSLRTLARRVLALTGAAADGAREAAADAAGAAGGCLPADGLRPSLPQGSLSGGAGGAVRRADSLPGAAGGPGEHGGAVGGPERGKGAGPVADLRGLSGKALPGRRGPPGSDGEAAGRAGGIGICCRKGCISGWLYILYGTRASADFYSAAGLKIRHRDPAGRWQLSGDLCAEHPHP